MNVGDFVIYKDNQGAEHNGLVLRVYPDAGGPGLDGVDLAHLDDQGEPVKVKQVVHLNHQTTAHWLPVP